jgi:hypothetical protein
MTGGSLAILSQSTGSTVIIKSFAKSGAGLFGERRARDASSRSSFFTVQ